MIKNIYDAVTYSVDAFQYFGIGIAALVFLLFLGKVYFSYYPLTQVKTNAPVHYYVDIFTWLNIKKTMLRYFIDKPVGKEVGVLGFEKKSCFIIFSYDNISVGELRKIMIYGYDLDIDIVINISSNAETIDDGVKSILNEIQNTSVIRKKEGKTRFYNYQTKDFNVETIISCLTSKKEDTVKVYNYKYFLKERQLQ